MDVGHKLSCISPFSSMPFQIVTDLVGHLKLSNYSRGQYVWDSHREVAIILFDGEIGIVQRTGLRPQVILTIEAGQCIDLKEMGSAGVVTSEGCMVGVLDLNILHDSCKSQPGILAQFKDEQYRRIRLVEQFKQTTKNGTNRPVSIKLPLALSPEQISSYQELKDNYRGLRQSTNRNHNEQRAEDIISQLKHENLKPIKPNKYLPFAELRLPGNFTNIYQMPRKRRSQLIEIAKKYRLTEAQQDILRTDQYYHRRKESQIMMKLQSSIDLARSKLTQTEFTLNSKDSTATVLAPKHTTQPNEGSATENFPSLNHQSRLTGLVESALKNMRYCRPRYQSWSNIKTPLSVISMSPVKPQQKRTVHTPKLRQQRIQQTDIPLNSPTMNVSTLRTLEEDEVDNYLASLKLNEQPTENRNLKLQSTRQVYRSVKKIGTNTLEVLILK